MITKHITNLLEKEGFVFVNGLGKFSKKFHEASIENGTMTPPYNEVTFDSSDNGNGFALIMHVANNENLGIVAADEKINQWVSQLKEELKQKNEAQITGFGTFHSQDGNITFCGEVISSLNTEYEGMDPIAEQKKQGSKNVVIADISLDEAFADEPNELQTEEVPVTAEVDTYVTEETTESNTVEEIPETDIETPLREEVATAEQTEEVPVTAEVDTYVTEETTESDAVEEIPETETEADVETIHREEAATEEQSERISKEMTVPVIPEPESEPVIEPEPEPETVSEQQPEIVEDRIEKENFVIEEPKSNENSSATEEDSLEDNTVEEEIEELTDKPSDKKRKFKWGYLLLILLILLLTAAAYYFRHDIQGYYQQWRQSRTTTITDTIKEPQTDIIEDWIAEEDTMATAEEEIIESEEVKVEEPVNNTLGNNNSDDIPEINFESGKYYVIAGSFVSSADAKRHIHNRNLEKYNPCILRQKGSERLRVCIGVFSTESEANALLAQENAKYWVLK